MKNFDMAAEAIEVQNVDWAVADNPIGHIGVTDRHLSGLGVPCRPVHPLVSTGLPHRQVCEKPSRPRDRVASESAGPDGLTVHKTVVMHTSLCDGAGCNA